ncbi:MAG: alpha/beta fold hydrolase [Thermoanaerobaculia bacterium]
MNENRWFPFSTRRKAASRIICLPEAGGRAATFREWQNLLPSQIEMIPVELPGHGTRYRETPLTRISNAVSAIADELDLDQTPVSLFGHSMGALLAFELAWKLHESKKNIAALFISGYPAPHLPWSKPLISHYGQAEFGQALVDDFGANASLLSDSYILALAYPTLRADLEMLETYIFEPRGLFTFPISVFGGDQDQEASKLELQAWQEHTSGRFLLRMLRGNHNFIHDSRASLIIAIKNDLGF